jgi:hypothetical protein
MNVPFVSDWRHLYGLFAQTAVGTFKSYCVRLSVKLRETQFPEIEITLQYQQL